ncbi:MULTISPECIES: DUF2218 domain-containing protein [unclassified Streptomyces]|uniref:DUF2218 domain-containing protein n=1 Tax=unclassified Streptomyces TaxID=2593676 RepID=UPI0038177D99
MDGVTYGAAALSSWSESTPVAQRRFHTMGVEPSRRAEGHLHTDQPARLLAGLRTDAERSGTRGTLDTPWGRCTLETGPDSLTIRVEAADEDGLRHVRKLVSDRLREIGGGEAAHVAWRPAGPAAPRPSRRGGKLVLALVVAVVVAAHLGLGGLLLASGPWRHWALGALLAVVLAKAAFLMLRRRRARRVAQS